MIAVGRVTSYGADSAARAAAGPVSELLSTSLARVSHLRVVSQARMLELIQLGAGVPDTSAGGFVNAARRGDPELVTSAIAARAQGPPSPVEAATTQPVPTREPRRSPGQPSRYGLTVGGPYGACNRRAAFER